MAPTVEVPGISVASKVVNFFFFFFLSAHDQQAWWQ